MVALNGGINGADACCDPSNGQAPGESPGCIIQALLQRRMLAPVSAPTWGGEWGEPLLCAHMCYTHRPLFFSLAVPCDDTISICCTDGLSCIEDSSDPRGYSCADLTATPSLPGCTVTLVSLQQPGEGTSSGIMARASRRGAWPDLAWPAPSMSCRPAIPSCIVRRADWPPSNLLQGWYMQRGNPPAGKNFCYSWPMVDNAQLQLGNHQYGTFLLTRILKSAPGKTSPVS